MERRLVDGDAGVDLGAVALRLAVELHPERRQGRDGEAEGGEEGGEIVAGLQIDAEDAGRRLDGGVERRAGRFELDLQRLAVAAQCGAARRAAAPDREGLVAEPAGAGQRERLALAPVRLQLVEGEGDVATRVAVVDPQIGDPELADFRQCERPVARGRLSLRQLPVQPALRVALDDRVDSFEHDRGQHDIALEQGAECELRRCAPERRQLRAVIVPNVQGADRQAQRAVAPGQLRCGFEPDREAGSGARPGLDQAIEPALLQRQPRPTDSENRQADNQDECYQRPTQHRLSAPNASTRTTARQRSGCVRPRPTSAGDCGRSW
ncbi:MAG: hypothetical protein R3D25_14700 [Geminicoccaceae bacterium]